MLQIIFGLLQNWHSNVQLYKKLSNFDRDIAQYLNHWIIRIFEDCTVYLIKKIYLYKMFG